MQPSPRSSTGTGFPTVVRPLCLGPVCGWVWVLLTPPVLAGVLGGCVWARFVVLSLFCRLFVVFVVGLRFRPAYGMCVVSCALCLPPAVSGSGVRCGRACWARVPAVPRLSWLSCRGVFFALPLFTRGASSCSSTGATPGGTRGRLSTTKCTYLPTYLCWLCLNPCSCMPLRRWDLGMGYGWGLSVYCPEAPLPQSMA